MRRLDDDKTISNIDKLVDRISGLNTISIGPITVELPEEYKYKRIGRLKFWEAESVDDLVKNYSIVSNLDKEDKEYNKKFNKWFQQTVREKNLSDEELDDLGEKLSRILFSTEKMNKEMRIPYGMENSNIVTMENIYIGNCKIFERKYNNKCNMNVKDGIGENIDAVMYYDPKFIIHENIHGEIEKLMRYKNYSKPFDITFKTIPIYEKKRVAGKSKLITHPPKINILSITSADGSKQINEPIDTKVYVPVNR